jgi:ferric-dicitrate binding protein FerR (iron transport regulator)
MHTIDAVRSKRLPCSGLWIMLAAALIGLMAATPAGAQSGACQFVPDDRNPSEQILRCGASLTVRQAAGTSFHAVDQKETRQPKALQLDEGALLIEFHARAGHNTFQILTPQSIAAVRGTKWAVEVGAGRSSTFVISGVVAVSRPGGHQTVLLRRGEGADVSPDSGPIVVKRWAAKRVQALLARFGE